MKIATAIALGAVFIVSPSIAAQTVEEAAPAVAVERLLPPNTILSVTPTAEISSKHIEKGDKFIFSVVQDVVENGVVVIRRGSTVTGTISWKTGRAIGGKSGKFEISWNTVTIGSKEYPLQGIHRQEGRGNTAAALLGSMVVSGRSAVLQPGNVVTAMTAQPIPY